MYLQDACKVRSLQVSANRKKSKRMSLSGINPIFSPKEQKTVVQSGITLKIGLKHHFLTLFNFLLYNALIFCNFKYNYL